jgi:hypothetical protein
MIFLEAHPTGDLTSGSGCKLTMTAAEDPLGRVLTLSRCAPQQIQMWNGSSGSWSCQNASREVRVRALWEWGTCPARLTIP